MRSAASNSSRTERSSDSQRANASTTDGSNCLPASSQNLAPGALPRQRAPVGPVARHRVERVGDREDPRADRNLVSLRAVGIAAAVPALVVAANDAQPVAVEEGDTAEHLLAEDGVRLHEPPLGLAQGTGLLENLVWNPDLAHVVEEESVRGALVRGERRLDALGQGDRVALHPLRVCSRARVLCLERARERRHSLLVRLLDEEPLSPLDLEEVAEVAGVEDQLLAGVTLSGRTEGDAVEPARQALDDGEELEWAEGLDEVGVRAGRRTILARCSYRSRSGVRP